MPSTGESSVLERGAPSERDQVGHPVPDPVDGISPGEPTDGAPPRLPAFGPMTQRRVLGMALPIIGENLLQTTVGTVDTLMVARLGSHAVAGVGTSVELIFFIVSALSAVSIGATVLVSQAFGARDVEGANRLARQAIIWGLLLSVPVSILGYFAAGWAIGLFGTEPDVAAAGTTYLQIVAATSVTLLLTLVCGAVLRGSGDSRTPLLASIVANLVNVVVAYVLIFGHFGLPRLGIAGSAWGAATGRAIGAGILVALLLGGRRVISVRGRSGWRPSARTAHRLLRLGIPTAVEEMLMAGGFTVLLAVVALLGTASLAAQQIGFTALAIAFMPGFGFSIAATALVGQSVGGRDRAAAQAATRIAMRWCIVWMAAGGLLYFVLARQVMGVFTDDPEVIENGVRALRALSVSLPFWAIWSVSGGALRGSGDTRTPMISSAVSVWLAVGLAWIVVRWFDGGLGSVWLTFLVTSPVGAAINWLALRQRFAPGSMVFEGATLGDPAGFRHP